jgi:hypothetical protein
MASFSETSIPTYQTIRRHIPEDSNLQSQHSEKLTPKLDEFIHFTHFYSYTDNDINLTDHCSQSDSLRTFVDHTLWLVTTLSYP